MSFASGLKILFAGTPDFACTILKSMCEQGFVPSLVLCAPARSKGRGLKQHPCEVQAFADERGIAVYSPSKLDKDSLAPILNQSFDILVTAAYGFIVPKSLLAHPTFGAINVHGSILPRWRGAAPIQRAILAGDPETGITLMKMDAGLDTGNILKIETTPLVHKTFGEIYQTLSQIGANLTVDYLKELERGTADTVGTVQPTEGITYAHKIHTSEAHINFDADANTVCNQINAYTPIPGAWAMLRNERVKLFNASVSSLKGTPGSILQLNPFTIAARNGAVIIEEIQFPNKNRMRPQAAFLSRSEIQPGVRFDDIVIPDPE